MPTRRQIQVADEIQQIISYLLQRELKDPRIGFTTITQVEVTGDLKYAKVFVSVMGTAQEQWDTMAALVSSRGFIRREIASRMQIRWVPEISFKLDTSAEYSDKINRLLNEIKEAESARDSGSEQAADSTGDAVAEDAEEAEAEAPATDGTEEQREGR